jgi:hypothetical protein
VKDQRFEVELASLKAAFGKVSVAPGGAGDTLWRLNARLPRGCTPTVTPVLLVLRPNERPQLYVKPGIKLPNGVLPRSTSAVQVAGEEWMQFSFSFAWDWQTGTLEAFIAASLQRFAQSE